ncbi:hypothetical protein [Nonomuraea sp. 10N515B]
MNPRQRYALAHPLTDPRREDLGAYRAVRRHATGLLLVSILAVDR